MEITGSNQELMIAKPLGNQQGLGVMGFCYAPYHFVYDLSFPVLIQISDGNEIFQFPLAVIIDKNMPRQAAFSQLEETETEDLCAFPTQDITVTTYATNLQKIDANISYECFNQICQLGQTNQGILKTKVPACLNGYVHAQASNFAEKKQIVSSNKESHAELIMDQEYPVLVQLEVDNKPLTGTALITFEGQETKTLSLPDAQQITLAEGLYNITVHVYGNTSIRIPATTSQQCYQAPTSGIAGIFGGTQEKCVQITLPETTIDYALLGGGSTTQYLLATDLTKGKIQLQVQGLPVPTSLEQLQYNYESFANKKIGVLTA